MTQPPVGSVDFVVGDQASAGDAWDRFLGCCGDAHFEQTAGWARVKQLYGWTPLWALALRGGEIAGGAMVLSRRLRPFGTIGYVFRGPVWRHGDPEAMHLATEAVHRLGRDRRITYLVVVPPYSASNLIDLLRDLHFHRKPDRLPPAVVTSNATLVIDLEKDLDTLFGQLSMTKRQNVRRAARKGVRVRLGDASDTQTFRQLMWASCQRRGISPSPPQPDFFDNLWEVYGASGTVRLFIAEIDGEPVSGAFTFVFGQTMHLWRVGWSGKHDGCKPNDALHWEAIKWAKLHGCRAFDFMHIHPAHARAILQRDRVGDSYAGVTDFKTGFGGDVRLLPEPYYRSFHPLAQVALRLGGARALELCSTLSAPRSSFPAEQPFSGRVLRKRSEVEVASNGA